MKLSKKEADFLMTGRNPSMLSEIWSAPFLRIYAMILTKCGNT